MIPFEDQFGHMRGSAECGVVQMKKERDEREREETKKRNFILIRLKIASKCITKEKKSF